MANPIKNQQDILDKLNIKHLNSMQEEALSSIKTTGNTLILSPTGTGKTLAFLLPIVNRLDPEIKGIQAMILVPSRELAIQIEQVLREMGSGYKVNAMYGGRAVAKDKIDLTHEPAILIGTPGRIADHFRQERFDTHSIKTLVLDEFDKSLEVGFEAEMKFIINELQNLDRRILTSATQGVRIPDFVGMTNPHLIDYLDQARPGLTVQLVLSPKGKKNHTLASVLHHLGDQPGIVFCNLKASIQEVSDFLAHQRIPHGCFHGDMEQKDRERALIQFRNGSHNLLVATDLAARGIDIPEITFIIHYELPYSKEEFTHRNGRTARVHKTGTAYVIKEEGVRLPQFINTDQEVSVGTKQTRKASNWVTLFISGGRKDKISKGDIAGLFFKQGNLTKEELGVIELKRDCAFVAVPTQKASQLIEALNNTRLKKKKVRITQL